MAEPIYEREALIKQVVTLLLKEREPVTAGAMALKLGLPMWALLATLESALDLHLVTHVIGKGYRLVPVETDVYISKASLAPVDSSQVATNSIA